MDLSTPLCFAQDDRACGWGWTVVNWEVLAGVDSGFLGDFWHLGYCRFSNLRILNGHSSRALTQSIATRFSLYREFFHRFIDRADAFSLDIYRN